MASSTRTITISYDGTAPVPRDVTLTIRDWCTDAPIPDASVTVSSATYTADTRIADAAGQVTFPLLPPGEYTLLISASGYLASDADSLANDTLTI